MAKKTTGKKRRAKRAGRPKGRGGVNKSQAIRDYLAENPNTPPRQIAAALTERGIRVTPMFVSAIKSKRRGRQEATRTRGARRGSASIEHLLAAKRFVAAVGGVDAARRALGALEQVLK